MANRFELSGNGNYVLVDGDRAENIPSSSIRGDTPGDPTSNKAELVSASLTDDDLAGGNFILQGFYSRTRDLFGGDIYSTFQDPSIAPVGTLFEQTANRSRKLGGKISYEREYIDVLVVTAGFDVLFDRTEQTLTQTGREWVPETTFRSYAPFVQGNLALADGLVRLAGGVRYEDVELTVDDFAVLAGYGGFSVEGGSPSFNDLLWNAGAIIEPVDGLRAYGSYAEGFTIADVGRILRSISRPNVDVDTFLSLEPVISNNRELGIEWDRGPLTASASYFWSSSDLGSVLVLRDDIFEVSRQPIQIEGLEASMVWRTPLRGLSMSGGVAVIEGKTDADNDGQVDDDLDGANISPNRLNLAADYSSGQFSARVQSRFYFERTFDDPTSATDFEGYTLLDAYLGYETDIGTFSLAVQNLTDEYFLTYDSDTVRVTSDSRFFSGRGRTFTLTWMGAF